MPNKLKRAFGDVTITAHVTNTEKEFSWYLESSGNCPNVHSRKTSHYQGILTLRVNKRLFGFATQYWEGALPTEEPFEIKLGIPAK